MRTIAYLRVSKDSQDVKNQRLTILDFARQERLKIDEFIELSVSATRMPKERKLDVLLERLKPQDTLLVSELSRMGRSVGEIITTVDTLVKGKIRFFAIKASIAKITGVDRATLYHFLTSRHLGMQRKESRAVLR